MRLEERLRAFNKWLIEVSFNSFNEFAKKTSYSDESTVFFELISLGDELKRSIHVGNEGHYDVCEELYRKTVKRLNTDIALSMLNTRIGELQDFGKTKSDAQLCALHELMPDARFRLWLPSNVYNEMTHNNSITGRSYGSAISL